MNETTPAGPADPSQPVQAQSAVDPDPGECAVWVLGVPVLPVTRGQALERIAEFIETGQPHLVITADASALILARKDREFREIMRAASMVTADGAGVVAALKLAGRALPERCSGVDLVVDLARECPERGWSLFLLGAAPGIAEKAAANLTARFPALTIAGCRDGFFQDDTEVVRHIQDTHPDILLVAMGMPRQEKWFWKHRDALGVKVAMGVGGTFDVLSGNVKRAPRFYQDHGLEWLYRCATAPSKGMRKLVLLPQFALLTLAEAMSRKWRGEAVGRKRKH